VSGTRTQRIVFDVTQYASWPATSGVQRVLHKLAAEWSSGAIDARFGFVEDERLVTGPLPALAPLMSAVFGSQDGSSTTSTSVRQELRKASDQTIAIDAIERSFRGYVLPEPTFQRESLAASARLRGSSRTTMFFLYYDALPLTHPQYFPRGTDRNAEVSSYHRAVAWSENVLFISRASRNTFETRIARRDLGNAIVVRPGADGLPVLPTVQPDRPTFAMLGTVEPRKRHRLVLDAFERLWAAGLDYRLVLIGTPGSEEPAFLDRLRHLARTTRIEWFDQASDRDIADVFSRSSAIVFISHAEGYGLPAVEALAAGCPVIASPDLPALEDLPEDGQLRLETVSTEGVASAIAHLAEPSSNEALRRAAKQLRLPTWRQFAAEVEDWIASGLR
jgi:glycosyltransferase involved in cell wall biosynthesis